MEATLQNLFYLATVTLIPKQLKTQQRRGYQNTFLYKNCCKNIQYNAFKLNPTYQKDHPCLSRLHAMRLRDGSTYKNLPMESTISRNSQKKIKI